MQDATPFKFLFLTAVEARNLKNVQMIGKQDPYLKLWVGRAGTKVQTNVHDGGGCSATWGESFKFSVERLHAEEYLYFKVKNKNITDTKTIGSGKVAIKTFGPTMQGSWYKLYDPNGRDAGEILLEGRLSRRGDKNTAMGEHGQDLLNASAGRGAPAGGPTAPMAWGTTGGVARPTAQQHSSMNQSSFAAATFPPPRSFAIHYAGSTHHHPGFSPAPTRPSTAYPGHKPSLFMPSAPPQPHYLEQRPSDHGGHNNPRRSSNAGATTTMTTAAAANIPLAWANRPTTASAASSYYPGPTAPSSLPTAPAAQPGFLGPRSSPYGGPRAHGGPRSYGGPQSYGGGHSHGGPHSYGGPRRLPHGWEEKVASTGRTFYVDHTTKTTSWVRPGEASHGVAR